MIMILLAKKNISIAADCHWISRVSEGEFVGCYKIKCFLNFPYYKKNLILP